MSAQETGAIVDEPLVVEVRVLQNRTHRSGRDVDCDPAMGAGIDKLRHASFGVRLWPSDAPPNPECAPLATLKNCVGQ